MLPCVCKGTGGGGRDPGVYFDGSMAASHRDPEPASSRD